MVSLQVWPGIDPASVIISEENGVYSLAAQKEFPTVCVHETLITSGQWYYEVTIAQDVLAQIGWATVNFQPDSKQGIGVGDDGNSYAYDGFRCLRWHAGSKRWGERWKKGDVVGVALDLKSNQSNISFSINGIWPVTPAFTELEFSHGYIPVATVQTSEKQIGLKFAFSRSSLKYKPPRLWDHNWRCVSEGRILRYHTLHGNLRFKAPLEELNKFLQSKKGKECVSTPDEAGRLPIHWAVTYQASVECFRAVYKAYPKALGIRDMTGAPKGNAIEVPLWRMHRWTGLKELKAHKIGRPDTLAIFRNAGRDQDVLRAQGKTVGVIAHRTTVETGVRIGIYKLKDVSQVERDTYNAALSLIDIAKISAIRQTEPYYIVRANIEPDLDQIDRLETEGELKYSGNLPFHTAIEQGAEIKIIEELLQLYPDGAKLLNKDDDIPLGSILKMAKSFAATSNEGTLENETLSDEENPMLKKLENLVCKILDISPSAATVVDRAGWTQLHHAAKNMVPSSIIKALLVAYPEAAKVRDVDGDLPLQKAAAASEKISLDSFNAILEAYPEAAKEADNYGQLPLHRACMNKTSLFVCEALIKVFPGALETASNHTANMPLHDALEHHASQDVSIALLDAHLPATKHANKRNLLPLSSVMVNGSDTDVLLFEKILKAYPEGAKHKSTDGSVPLHEAMYKKLPFRITELLIEAYPEACAVVGGPNKSLPIHWAVYRSTEKVFEGEKVIKLLISKNKDGLKAKEKDGCIALHNALYGCSLELLKILLDEFPGGCYEKNSSGETPLHVAMKMSSRVLTPQMVTCLIKKGSEAVRSVDLLGNLPIHILAQNDRADSDVLKLLMEAYPESVTIPNHSAKTPLIVAAKAGNTKFAKTLLDAYPNTAQRKDPWTGMTCLHYACLSDTPSLDLIVSLLKLYPEAAKIEADKASKESLHVGGLTPLYLSISATTDTKIVTKLLEAYPEACNIQDTKNGLTPLHKAGTIEKKTDSDEYNILGICKLLSMHTSDAIRDKRSRRWKDICIGSQFEMVREWARALDTKFGRYKLDSNRPIYRSASCDVFFAKDIDPETPLNQKNVALKIMHVQENFEHEKKQRSEARLDGQYVVRVLRDHIYTLESENSVMLSDIEFEMLFDSLDLNGSGKLDVDEVFAMLKNAYGDGGSSAEISMERAKGLISKLDYKQDGALSKEEFKMLIKLDHELAKKISKGKAWAIPNEYCLVMPQAERNLLGAIMAENFAGRDILTVRKIAFDVATALQHMHEQNFVHGDIKPRNIVRVGERWKLIDLDAAVKVGEPIGRKYSGGYAPPEFIWQLLRRNDKTVSNRSIDDKIDECKMAIKEAVENSKYEKIGDLHAKLESLKNDKNVENSTSETDLLADPSFDIWSYGVLLFELFTGTDLFNRDKNSDNLVSKIEKNRVLRWSGLQINHGAQNYDQSCLVPFFGVSPKLRRTSHGAPSSPMNKPLSTLSVAVNGVSEERALEARSLCVACLNTKPKDRIKSMGDILSHPFFVERKSSIGNKALPEEDGCKWHFMISHYQATGGDQSNTLSLELEKRGWKVWYDNNMQNLTTEGMKEGVRCSAVFILFLSKDVFSRHFVKVEVLEALEQKKPFILVHETNQHHGAFDFSTGIKDGVDNDFQKIAEKIVNNIESIGWERRDFKRKAVLEKIEEYFDAREDHRMEMPKEENSVNNVREWLKESKIDPKTSETLEKVICEKIGCSNTAELAEFWDDNYLTEYIDPHLSTPITKKKFKKALHGIGVKI